jgi:hypothetical protein
MIVCRCAATPPSTPDRRSLVLACPGKQRQAPDFAALNPGYDIIGRSAMPLVPFGEFRPDVSDYQAASSRNIANVLPRGDGYGPFADLQAFTAALPAPCRGFFYAKKTDGSVSIFAGTAARLYNLNNSTFAWTDVSLGGAAYSALSATANWTFVQFGNLVVAVQANVAPQVFDLTSSVAFANLAGSPPQAAYVAVVGQFLVLSGLLSTPYRIQWSGLNATTTWTPGVNQSDFQDFPDGGIVRGVAGGEFGVIFQDTQIRRMTYAPGSPVIFQIDRLAEDKGLFAPYGIIRAGDRVFFPSPQGFNVVVPGGLPTPIGKERVDRSFAADIDAGNLQLMIGSADPNGSRVFWAYKSINGTAGLFDKLLCYDWGLDRWTGIAVSGQYLATLAKPGITEEGLDLLTPGAQQITGTASNGSGLVRLTVASTSGFSTGQVKNVTQVTGTTEANGTWTITVIDPTHIDLQGSAFSHAYVSGGVIGGNEDLFAFSFDSISNASFPAIAAFNGASQLGFFNGASLEATLETAEQGAGGRRLFVRGFRPVSDAAAIYGAVSTRENLQAAPLYGSESLVNAQGLCPQRASTRYARGRIRIPYATAWTFAAGIEPDITLEGVR